MGFLCCICHEDLTRTNTIVVSKVGEEKKDESQQASNSNDRGQVKERPIVTTKCGHLYHSDCLKNWFQKRGSEFWTKKECPSCRMSLTVATDLVRIFTNNSVGDDGAKNNSTTIEDYKNQISKLENANSILSNNLEVSFLRSRTMTKDLEKLQKAYTSEKSKLEHFQSEAAKLLTENEELKNVIINLNKVINAGTNGLNLVGGLAGVQYNNNSSNNSNKSDCNGIFNNNHHNADILANNHLLVNGGVIDSLPNAPHMNHINSVQQHQQQQQQFRQSAWPPTSNVSNISLDQHLHQNNNNDNFNFGFLSSIAGQPSNNSNEDCCDLGQFNPFFTNMVGFDNSNDDQNNNNQNHINIINGIGGSINHHDNCFDNLPTNDSISIMAMLMNNNNNNKENNIFDLSMLNTTTAKSNYSIMSTNSTTSSSNGESSSSGIMNGGINYQADELMDSIMANTTKSLSISQHNHHSSITNNNMNNTNNNNNMDEYQLHKKPNGTTISTTSTANNNPSNQNITPTSNVNSSSNNSNHSTKGQKWNHNSSNNTAVNSNNGHNKKEKQDDGDDSNGKKLYGKFSCQKCKAKWGTSRHILKKAQTCLRCNQVVFPYDQGPIMTKEELAQQKLARQK